ncbi:thiamine phosphate synthase [Desulfogranum mediterraneum]|uniref:thiamine phosphate synthase n=1 Tax=Desulfogranum mediterraneum TaxID=160661 RepID=UPI000400DF4D|nr:thiamine phosphate synthase [Desulfogranum mediterraneum]
MNRAKPTLPSGLYGITAERLSQGRSNLEVARAMIDGGIKVIQYREKRHLKSYQSILEECRQIRELTRNHGVVFIVNDFVDIAQLVDADGVHVGQDDLPVEAVRRLLGPDKLIGLSTHSPAQADAAATVGADYIGVGPIYATQTKEDVCAPVGLEYLDYAVNHSDLPFVAIGGIKEDTITEVTGRGAESVCLVSEIVGAEDIPAMVRTLNQSFNQ